MLEKLALLNAETIRGLIYATLPLIALIATLLGVDEAVFNREAEKWTQGILAFATLGGIAWAAWARIFRATPALTNSAQQDELFRLKQQLAANGQEIIVRNIADSSIANKITPAAPGAQRGFASIGAMLAMCGLAMFAVSALIGCKALEATNTAQAVRNAQNPADYALVFLHGYHAAVKTARMMKDAGTLEGADLERVREMELEAYQFVRLIEPLRGAYDASPDAETGAALQRAVDQAAGAAAKFIREVQQKEGA